MFSQASLGSTPHSYDTKTWSHLRKKTLAQQTERGQVLDRQRLRMLHELGA
jgi:hypothetical protein